MNERELRSLAELNSLHPLCILSLLCEFCLGEVVIFISVCTPVRAGTLEPYLVERAIDACETTSALFHRRISAVRACQIYARRSY